jgi:ABC-type transporter Mla MlaB component
VITVLKITIEPEADEVRMKLEGDLAGTWVRDLEECWRATRSSSSGKVACLDLSDVSRVDDAGRYLLALIHETGARMISTGVAMKDLLDSISRDWPLRRIEGPGWAAIPSPRPPRF